MRFLSITSSLKIFSWPVTCEVSSTFFVSSDLILETYFKKVATEGSKFFNWLSESLRLANLARCLMSARVNLSPVVMLRLYTKRGLKDESLIQNSLHPTGVILFSC